MQNLRDTVGASLVDFNSYLNSLGAYNLNAGVDSLLDQSREINESGKFYFMGSPFPMGNDTTFAPFETKQGSVNLQSYTFINSISIYCSDPAGIKFSIYDKGAKVYLFQTIYAKEVTVASNLDQTPTVLANSGNLYPQGPYFLTSPLIILPPGVLQIEMTSLSSNNNVIAQMMLGCAVPITPTGTNVNVGSSTTNG